MANTVQLDVITPEKLFYRGEVELVIARTLYGDEGFMANHAWACILLSTGELWLKEAGAKDYRIAAISGGFIDVKDKITIFTDAAEWPEEIDLDRAKDEESRAREFLFGNKTGVVDARALADARTSLKKAGVRQGVAAGGVRRKH